MSYSKKEVHEEQRKRMALNCTYPPISGDRLHCTAVKRFHVWSEYGVGCSFSNMVMVKRRWKGLGKAWSWVGYGAEEDFYKQTYLRYLGLSSSKHRCRMAIKGTDVDESKIHGHWCSLLASAKGPYIWWFILLKARILFPSPLINTRHAP